jgi:DNA-binding NarL/FixJ family response regulator
MAEVGIGVLIVARPGPVQEGLKALLGAIGQVEAIYLAEDLASARQVMVETRPSLVVFDAALPDGEVAAVLGAVKGEWPEARCIALTDGTGQERAATEAGADVVFRQGLPPVRLVAVVKNLLS